MGSRSWIFIGTLVVGGWLLGQVASPLWGQQNDQPAGNAASEEKALNVRYAQAYLDMMQATLQKYEDTNRRAPNTIRPTIIEGLRESVGKAQARLEAAKSDSANPSQLYVTASEAELRLAEKQLGAAEATNRRRAGTIGEGEVNRLRAQRDLAKVRVEKAQHLAVESPLANVHFELEQLREEVQELRLLVALLRFRN